MKRALLFGLAFIGMHAAPAAAAGLETSLRASAWSGSRETQADEGAIGDLEIWGRGQWELTDNFSLHGEGWVGTDPVGQHSGAFDIREAYLSWREGPFRVDIGRKIFAWGRADRLNPTDVLGARDLRRLVEDEGDTRLGVASISGQADLYGGQLSLVWAPEFRPTDLPVTLTQPGVHVVRDYSQGEHQFAVRYERFGHAIDWSVTYAEVLDSTPWLSLASETGATATLSLSHPRLTMFGADAATTLGQFGLRFEGALYDYDVDALRGAVTRVPAFAASAGIDRTIFDNTNINLQFIAHIAEAAPGPATQPLGVRQRNDTLRYVWRDTVTGGLLRIRHNFAQDRASIELSTAAFAGGGNYQQARLSYTLRDGVRLTAIGERFDGEPSSLFGRLKDNSLITFGIRLGY